MLSCSRDANLLRHSDSTPGKKASSTADQRLLNQLLLEMDACQQRASTVFVLAATNLPWQLDPAILRRFPKRVHVGRTARKSTPLRPTVDATARIATFRAADTGNDSVRADFSHIMDVSDSARVTQPRRGSGSQLQQRRGKHPIREQRAPRACRAHIFLPHAVS